MSIFRPGKDKVSDAVVETKGGDGVLKVCVTVAWPTVAKVLFVAAVAFGLLKILVAIAPFLVTLAVSVFLAVAADPVVRWLQKRGLSRGLAVTTLFLGFLVVLVAAVAIFVPPLVRQGNSLARHAPGYVHRVQKSEGYDKLQKLDKQYHVLKKASKAVEKLPGKVSAQLGTVLGAVLSGAFGLLTVMFLVAFLLLGGGELVGAAAVVFPQIGSRRWWGVTQEAYSSIGAYVAGTLVISVIAGTVITLSLLALGLPSPLPLGLWMALLDVVPLIGATIGAAPAVLVAFVAGGVVKGLIMLAIIIIYQQLENNVIQPGVLGKAVSLSPLVIFVAVLVGSQLMGVLGALFSVPVAGIIQIVIQELLGDRSDQQVDLPPIAPEPPDLPDPPEGMTDGPGAPQPAT